MKRIHRLAVLAAFIMAVSVVVPKSGALAVSYKYYANPGLGYSIVYPTFFNQSQPLSGNRDGLMLSGKNGGKTAELLIWGTKGGEYKNGKEMRKTLKSYGAKMTSIKATKKELSYYTNQNGSQTFRYNYFVKGGIVSFSLTYPKKQKNVYRSVITKITKSVKKNKALL